MRTLNYHFKSICLILQSVPQLHQFKLLMISIDRLLREIAKLLFLVANKLYRKGRLSQFESSRDGRRDLAADTANKRDRNSTQRRAAMIELAHHIIARP